VSARRPNLFVVGSMKAGTTSLARYLGAHPEIFMTSDPKEPTYFLTREQLLDVLPGVEKRGFWRGEEYYLRLFEPAGDRPVVGEASANYARLPRVPGVAGRIRAFNPEAKILFIARDPVVRTLSHYWYMVRFFGERRDLLTAIRDDPDYVQTSNYPLQLRPYLDLFGHERVRLVTTEVLAAEPEATLSGIFRWLGVAADYAPPNLAERANETPDVVTQVRGGGLLHRFRHSALWNTLGPRVPASLRGLGRRFSEKPVERRAVDPAAARAWLRPVQRPQVTELESLLGRRFPEWTTLHGED
jgi:hypothetical protein